MATYLSSRSNVDTKFETVKNAFRERSHLMNESWCSAVEDLHQRYRQWLTNSALIPNPSQDLIHRLHDVWFKLDARKSTRDV